MTARARMVLLVRHAECVKNTLGMVGSSEGADLLTPRGSEQAAKVARAIEAASAVHGSFELIVADSERARLSAVPILETGCAQQVSTVSIRSISMGIAEGFSEARLREDFPTTFEDLAFYRAGLLNSYQIRLPEGAEDQRQFEMRTVLELEQRVARASTPWVVCVLHRSPITTLCIHAARSAGRYPLDFFGYVDVAVERPYLLSLGEEGFNLCSAGLELDRLVERLGHCGG